MHLLNLPTKLLIPSAHGVCNSALPSLINGPDKWLSLFSDPIAVSLPIPGAPHCPGKISLPQEQRNEKRGKRKDFDNLDDKYEISYTNEKRGSGIQNSAATHLTFPFYLHQCFGLLPPDPLNQTPPREDPPPSSPCLPSALHPPQLCLSSFVRSQRISSSAPPALLDRSSDTALR